MHNIDIHILKENYLSTDRIFLIGRLVSREQITNVIKAKFDQNTKHQIVKFGI